MVDHHCRHCKATTPHRHMHDTAHGIPETHMAGSERFECSACGLTTHSTDANALDFKFVLDRVEPDK